MQNIKNTDFGTFFHATKGTWKRCNKPKRKPDYVSKRKYMGIETKCISSQYWYGSDSKGDYIIRQSDHWGNVATCFWLLTKGRESEKTTLKCGKIYINQQ